MDNTLYIPNHPIVILIVSFIPVMMAYLGGILKLRSNTFKPGSQYITTVGRIKELKKKEESKAGKDVNKQQKARAAEDKFNLTAKRMGLKITYQENNKRRTIMLLPAMTLMIIGLMITIMTININMMVSFIAMMLSIVVPLYLLFAIDIKMTLLRRHMHNDMIKDISRMVSLYKYADTKQGIYGTILDFINDATALRIDLEMFLADLNSFELNEALDRMGSRVPVTEMSNFISYVKSSSYMTSEQVVYSVMALDNELRTQVKDIFNKESKSKFSRSMRIILVCFVAMLLIFMAPQVAELNFGDLM